MTTGHEHNVRAMLLSKLMESSLMARDAVVAETRRIRDRLAKARGYDLRKITRALQQEEARSRRKLLTLPAKLVRPGHL